MCSYADARYEIGFTKRSSMTWRLTYAFMKRNKPYMWFNVSYFLYLDI